MSVVSIRDMLVLALPVGALGVAGCAAAIVALEGRTRRALVARAGHDEGTATALLRAVPQGLLVLRESQILSVNPWLCTLLGQERASLIGAVAPFPFVAPELQHRFDAWLERLHTCGSAEEELVLRAADGRRIVVEMAGNVVAPEATTLRYVVAVRDMTDVRKALDALGSVVVHDTLTGLLDRRGLQAQLVEEVRRARASEKPLSLALLELEPFDDGNADDHALVAAVQFLRGSVRAGEHLARTRPRELAWVLPETDAAGAAAAVERVRDAAFVRRGPAPHSLITAGICELGEAADALTLYALADRALADARSRQRGGTASFSSADPLPAPPRLVADDLVPTDV
jgi:diguanylate cyclase (GGDEF)-like protein/PAS domain S-box-containing protein